MKRIEQKEQTRKQILEVAFKEFSAKGMIGTKTAEIAQSCGLSHGALFVHFKTKDELISQVLDIFGLRMGKKLQELAKNKGSPREILQAHLDMIEEFEEFYAHLVIEGPMLPSALRSKVFMIQSGIAYHLEKSLSKEIKDRVPTKMLINSWLGLIHYYLTHRDLFAPGKSVIATCGRELLNFFIRAHIN